MTTATRARVEVDAYDVDIDVPEDPRSYYDALSYPWVGTSVERWAVTAYSSDGRPMSSLCRKDFETEAAAEAHAEVVRALLGTLEVGK